MTRLIGKWSSKKCFRNSKVQSRGLKAPAHRSKIVRGDSKPYWRTSFIGTHKKLAIVGSVVSLSALALPSPWSWITVVLGLQLFAPLVGLCLNRSRQSDKEMIIADIVKRLDELDREIIKLNYHENSLVPHNKRIEYNTLAKLLEKLRKED